MSNDDDTTEFYMFLNSVYEASQCGAGRCPAEGVVRSLLRQSCCHRQCRLTPPL